MRCQLLRQHLLRNTVHLHPGNFFFRGTDNGVSIPLNRVVGIVSAGVAAYVCPFRSM